MVNLINLPMPGNLRQMELKILNGIDPDSILGIERLWLWRLAKWLPVIEASEIRFIAEIRFIDRG